MTKTIQDCKNELCVKMKYEDRSRGNESGVKIQNSSRKLRGKPDQLKESIRR